jgi:sugar fermentation stimulation protein A
MGSDGGIPRLGGIWGDRSEATATSGKLLRRDALWATNLDTFATMNSWFYPYPDLYAGTLVKRYKRFFADIELDTGELITAHCPNTGPMTGVYLPGNRVMVSKSDNPKRKLAYTWELIEVHDNEPTWVGVNTGLPNRVVKSVLEARAIPELGRYDQVQSEVTYGRDRKSRVDFVLTGEGDAPPIYIEVKNTTWVQGRLAMFPDTVTTRGQKHLRELTDLTDAKAVMLYFINRGDCDRFAPGDSADPTYGMLLREAIAQGLQVLPCRFDISPAGIRYLGLATLDIDLG